ncbi:protein N-acetylglucosaminyltransferase [Aureococcus anophagefferens]|nr:protein N-acetylglucosaminyltransferase [Aureococcus anophagefferens]
MTARRTICKWAGFEETQRGLLAIVEASLADFEAGGAAAGVGRRGVDLAVMPYDATLLQHFPNDVLRRLTSAQVFQRFGHAAPPPPRRARRSRLADHDPAVVETFVLSYGENDASVLRRERRPGGFLELFDADVAAAKRGMDALDLDVVVDLMTHTRARASSSRASPSRRRARCSSPTSATRASRAAPDYTMADAKVLPPDHAAATAEPLIYLPFSYQANDYGAHWPPADLGGGAGPRYCNFNQIDKYEPESFTLWMGALRRPTSPPPLTPAESAAASSTATARPCRRARDRFLWKHVAEKWEAHFLGRAT